MLVGACPVALCLKYLGQPRGESRACSAPRPRRSHLECGPLSTWDWWALSCHQKPQQKLPGGVGLLRVGCPFS